MLQASRVDYGAAAGWCNAVRLGPRREEPGFGAYDFPHRLRSGQREKEEGEEGSDNRWAQTVSERKERKRGRERISSGPRPKKENAGNGRESSRNFPRKVSSFSIFLFSCFLIYFSSNLILIYFLIALRHIYILKMHKFVCHALG